MLSVKFSLYISDMYRSFPGGSDSKESACNAEDLGSSLGQEDPLEKGMITHSSILAWEIPWTEELVGYSPKDRKESDMTERLLISLSYIANNT